MKRHEAASKLCAGREKDLRYIAVLLRHSIIDKDLLGRILQSELPQAYQALCKDRLLRIESELGHSTQE